MKLCQDPQAVIPRRVREKGIEVATVGLAVLEGEHKQPPFADDHANLKRWYEAVPARPSAGA